MIDEAEIRERFAGLESLRWIPGAGYRELKAVVLMGDAGIFDPEKYCDEKASVLFDREAEDPDANYALRLAAIRFLWAGKPLPPRLASFVEKALVAGKPALKGRPPDYARNLMLVDLIQRVCDENGLNPTRGDAEKNKEGDDAVESDKVSACKFVADALTDHGFKERGLEEIWNDRDLLRIRAQPPKRRKPRPA